jgi:hypothetical protein
MRIMVFLLLHDVAKRNVNISNFNIDISDAAETEFAG